MQLEFAFNWDPVLREGGVGLSICMCDEVGYIERIRARPRNLETSKEEIGKALKFSLARCDNLNANIRRVPSRAWSNDLTMTTILGLKGCA